MNFDVVRFRDAVIAKYKSDTNNDTNFTIRRHHPSSDQKKQKQQRSGAFDHVDVSSFSEFRSGGGVHSSGRSGAEQYFVPGAMSRLLSPRRFRHRSDDDDDAQKRRQSSYVVSFVDCCHQHHVPEHIIAQHALYMIHAMEDGIYSCLELHRRGEENRRLEYEASRRNILADNSIEEENTKKKKKNVVVRPGDVAQQSHVDVSVSTVTTRDAAVETVELDDAAVKEDHPPHNPSLVDGDNMIARTLFSEQQAASSRKSKSISVAAGGTTTSSTTRSKTREKQIWGIGGSSQNLAPSATRKIPSRVSSAVTLVRTESDAQFVERLSSPKKRTIEDPPVLSSRGSGAHRNSSSKSSLNISASAMSKAAAAAAQRGRARLGEPTRAPSAAALPSSSAGATNPKMLMGQHQRQERMSSRRDVPPQDTYTREDMSSSMLLQSSIASSSVVSHHQDDDDDDDHHPQSVASSATIIKQRNRDAAGGRLLDSLKLDSHISSSSKSSVHSSFCCADETPLLVPQRHRHIITTSTAVNGGDDLVVPFGGSRPLRKIMISPSRDDDEIRDKDDEDDEDNGVDHQPISSTTAVQRSDKNNGSGSRRGHSFHSIGVVTDPLQQGWSSRPTHPSVDQATQSILADDDGSILLGAAAVSPFATRTLDPVPLPEVPVGFSSGVQSFLEQSALAVAAARELLQSRKQSSRSASLVSSSRQSRFFNQDAPPVVQRGINHDKQVFTDVMPMSVDSTSLSRLVWHANADDPSAGTETGDSGRGEETFGCVSDESSNEED